MDYQNKYLQLHKDLHEADVDSKVGAIANILPKDGKIHSILDVGCGSGKILIQLSQLLGTDKNTGIDISQKIIEVAKSNDPDGIISWLATDVFSPTLSKHDVVLAVDIVEHVQDDHSFLKRISQLGDFVVIKVPIEVNIVNRFIKSLSNGIIDPCLNTEVRYGHIHHYSVEGFLSLLDGSSLRVIKVAYMHLPKRSRIFWEILRVIFMPLWLMSRKYYVKCNGGFLVVLLGK
jgi:SAM-dependent methyltransferase